MQIQSSTINNAVFSIISFFAVIFFAVSGTAVYAHQTQQTEEKILEISNVKEKTFLENSIDFICLGIVHILRGPDHILFVISIVLVLLPIRKIALMVTTFTLAHSVTFILAGSEILVLSAKIVEPIIALSIAYMDITTVFLKNIKFFQKMHSRLGVIFTFGLFHGLGFASVFSDIEIPSDNALPSLLFFNVGVEFGQILILLPVVLTLILIKKDEKIYESFIEIIAGFISVIAIFWFLQRIFF